MTTASTAGKKLLVAFTAVDLVTMAALGALSRTMSYPMEALGFIFPFNTFVLCLGFGFTELVAGMIVRKPGVFTMTNIAGLLVNFFLQGEMLVASFVFLGWSILADVYVYLRMRSGKDPWSSMRDMLIAALTLAIMWPVLTYILVFPWLYLLVFPIGIVAGLCIGGFICVMVGSWLGILAGKRIKGLLG